MSVRDRAGRTPLHWAALQVRRVFPWPLPCVAGAASVSLASGLPWGAHSRLLRQELPPAAGVVAGSAGALPGRSRSERARSSGVLSRAHGERSGACSGARDARARLRRGRGGAGRVQQLGNPLCGSRRPRVCCFPDMASCKTKRVAGLERQADRMRPDPLGRSAVRFLVENDADPAAVDSGGGRPPERPALRMEQQRSR
jgi:hypothetical protein